MNEKQFLKTMIETIKYDEDIQNKDDLLGILRYSIVTFRKTGAYTHGSNQRQFLDIMNDVPSKNKVTIVMPGQGELKEEIEKKAKEYKDVFLT